MITWQLSNLILGNADGDLKNISLLYERGAVGLAPFYDTVCTRNYEAVERELAMDIGGERDSIVCELRTERAQANYGESR